LDFEVTETFFVFSVADMNRAVAFYSESLRAATRWTSPRWSSLEVAGVRIGLFADPTHGGGRMGLHFSVTDLDAACASVVRAGGKIVAAASQVAPNVFVAEIADTEGNIFSLQRAG
jgi:predicted enzyme related to lactoylglutathione lyase